MNTPLMLRKVVRLNFLYTGKLQLNMIVMAGKSQSVVNGGAND